MSRARDLSKLANPAVFSVDTSYNVGINSTSPDTKLDVDGVVSATSYQGDGLNIAGIVTATSASFTGNVSVGGTLTYEDVKNVDSVGLITARNGIHVLSGSVGIGTTNPVADLEVHTNVSSGISSLRLSSETNNNPICSLEFKRGPGPAFGESVFANYRIISQSGHINLDRVASGIAYTVVTLTNTRQLGFGTDPLGRVHIYSNTSGITDSSQIAANGDELILESAAQTGMTFASPNTGGAYINFTDPDDTTPGQILYDHTDNYLRVKVNDSERLRIVSTGNVGIGTTQPRGLLDIEGRSHFQEGLVETVEITSGKLSANQNINLRDGNVHLFETTETAVATPNIRYSNTTSLNSVMAVGETISVSLITTAAAAGYATTINIDGSETGALKWNGGSAPSAGGDGGNDVYTYQIIKTADATYTVLANVSNFA